MSARRPWLRPYLFEVVLIANLVLIHALASRTGLSILGLIPRSLVEFTPALIGYTLAGVIIRALVASYRGELAAYVRVIRSAGWLTDTLRLIVFGALLMHAYFWLKLLVPVLHRRLFDQGLWDLEQTLLAGFSPNILFIEMFSHPISLRAIDWSYARVFFVSLTVAFVFFLSAPSRRLRLAFTTGNTFLWLTGAWLYLLVPSLGPAYRFPDVWLPLAAGLPLTQHFQALLLKNYQAVMRLAEGAGGAGEIRLVFGIAAFPSLHVAFQTYAFLWMRRVWIYGQIVFGIFMVLILIGSVVTGWHYLIDGLAGIVMAGACYWLSSRLWRVPEWLRLRRIQHRD